MTLTELNFLFCPYLLSPAGRIFLSSLLFIDTPFFYFYILLSARSLERNYGSDPISIESIMALAAGGIARFLLFNYLNIFPRKM